MKKKMYEIFYLVYVVDICIDEILMKGFKVFMLLKVDVCCYFLVFKICWDCLVDFGWWKFKNGVGVGS